MTPCASSCKENHEPAKHQIRHPRLSVKSGLARSTSLARRLRADDQEPAPSVNMRRTASVGITRFPQVDARHTRRMTPHARCCSAGLPPESVPGCQVAPHGESPAEPQPQSRCRTIFQKHFCMYMRVQIRMFQKSPKNSRNFLSISLYISLNFAESCCEL